MRYRLLQISVALAFGAAMSDPTFAATLCVGSGSGCHSTIGAAVTAASPGDTIQVGAGTYHEMVVIDKALSLIGAGQRRTIIDALGLAYGVNVDGFHHPGLAHVVVTGFTIKNANLEGIFITNASDATVRENEILRNNRNLNAGACPGLLPPDSDAGEAFDCGEGIHLSGVDHSTIASNLVQHNSGGILLSDDSGPTHDNLISGNIVRENESDCGITLASHKPVAPNGVYHNTIAGNESARNGLATGEGAGVGLFTPAPGTATFANVVVGNKIIDNGLPGVALHSHAPGQNLNDNAIIANYIAGNGADTDDTATPGPTGINIASGRTPTGIVVGSAITGTIVSQNVIERESVAIAVSNPAGAGVNLHLNDIEAHHIGLDNLGAGTVNAIENWWGCSRGPGAPGCSTIVGSGVTFAPWLREPTHDDKDHK
jgi:parallel beta-helix repeat protein